MARKLATKFDSTSISVLRDITKSSRQKNHPCYRSQEHGFCIIIMPQSYLKNKRKYQ